MFRRRGTSEAEAYSNTAKSPYDGVARRPRQTDGHAANKCPYHPKAVSLRCPAWGRRGVAACSQ
eukprot:6023139-Lingulodinium_polyedra.AAC.1